MIRVDTSVWVAVLRKRQPLDLEAVAEFDAIVTCLPVVQEVLQGIRDETAYRRAREALFSFPIVEDPLERQVFVEAVDLYRTARSAGITVRSSVDCIIAACAIRNGLEVLHADRDFTQLAKVSRLSQRNI